MLARRRSSAHRNSTSCATGWPRRRKQLGDEEKALKYYRQAYELDATHLPTLVDRANLLYRRQQWDEAFKLYQTILVHHRESQSEAEIVEIFHRIGHIKMMIGDRAKGHQHVREGAGDQSRPPTHAGGVDRDPRRRRRWEAVIRQKRALLAHVESDEEKLRLHEEIIEVYKERLNNPQKAIAAYLEALEVKPDARGLLANVLELLTETKQWKKAVEILLRLAAIETGRVKAKYLETAGQITNAELHSPDEAVELYNKALDEYPDDLKPFERIDKIMTAKKDWTNQQRAYRRMIKRLGAEVPRRSGPPKSPSGTRWARFNRSRLKDYCAAAEAFEACARLEPENMPRHQILAELYQMQGPEAYDKAVRQWRVILKHTQDIAAMVPILKTLRHLFTEMGKYDQVWCTASALAYLRQADTRSYASTSNTS